MNSNVTKAFLVLAFVFLVATQFFVEEVGAAGECGRTPIRAAATSLSPCLSAAGNARAKVPPACCTKVGALIKTAPKCLCAVLLSPLAKQAGINPAIAIAIPKRSNISGTDLLERSVEGTPSHKPKSQSKACNQLQIQ